MEQKEKKIKSLMERMIDVAIIFNLVLFAMFMIQYFCFPIPFGIHIGKVISGINLILNAK